jgi:cellulose synthase/poly-beta-1,6-N-acetylglucosamine synthase-like glycosyltransferase
MSFTSPNPQNKNAQSLESNSRPSLSIVIIGRNEGERLDRCIRSAQTIQGWRASEILYVDSGSTDDSLEMAARLGATVLPLPPGPFTAARARNYGWHRANGEVILFLDGDTILNADFPVIALTKLMESPTNAASWGHRREISPCTSLYVRVLDLDWVYAPGETQFFGGDVLVRRSALESVNGFDESLIAGEEPEMCRRMRNLGWIIQHIDVPMTLHDLAITRFSQYWLRAQRAGFAFAAVATRFRDTPDPFWSKEVARNRQRAIFWLLSPVLLLAASIALLSPVPILLWVLLILLVTARSAWQSRWKPAPWQTVALYGFHSHFQQVPIFFGQLQFMSNHNKPLMEYKDVATVPAKPEPRRP